MFITAKNKTSEYTTINIYYQFSHGHNSAPGAKRLRRVLSARAARAFLVQKSHHRHKHSPDPHAVYIAPRTRANGLHQRTRIGTQRARRPNRRAAHEGQRHVVPSRERRRRRPVGGVDAGWKRAGAREHADLAARVLGFLK